MLRILVQLIFRFVTWIVYASYGVEGVNALLLILPAKMIPGLLRKHGATIGDGVEIHSPIIIHNACSIPGKHYSNLLIGNECYFGRDVFLDIKSPVSIEDQVTISMRVTLITHTDVGRSPIAKRIQPSQSPIKIERGAYIGASATILQGVNIGPEAIIGAGALVRCNIPGRVTATGIPAKYFISDEQKS